MDEKTRLKARELLLRSRIYRFTAMIFAAIGLMIFLYLYFSKVQGDIMQALGNPAIVAIILFPFLPAVVVSWMAVRTENKFLKVLSQLDDPLAEDGKKSGRTDGKKAKGKKR